MSSFHVDARIDVKLEYELAVRLGEFIVNSGTIDKQIMALGYKLFNIDEETPSIINKKHPIPMQESSLASDWEDSCQDNPIPSEITRPDTMRDKVYSVKRTRTSDKIRWGHE